MFRSAFTIVSMLLCAICLPGQEQDKAPPNELIEYVREAQSAGQTALQIQQNAIKAGWPANLVDNAIDHVRAAEAAKSQPSPEKTGEAAPAGTPQSPAKTSVAPETVQIGRNSPPSVTSGGKSAENRGAATASGNSPAPGVEPDPGNPTARASANAPDDYQIGAGDVLKITVWHEPDASLPSAVVLPNGRISVPLLHEIEVAGLTVPQLEKLLTDRFSAMINTPAVSVIVTGMNSKRIYITGKVKKEGPLSYTYQMTVMQALSEAGGVTEYAKKKGIYVLRNEDGRQFKIPFDYAAVLKGEHLETNSVLIPGDMIVVP